MQINNNMDYRKNFFYKMFYERPYYGPNLYSLYGAAKNNKYLLQRFRCLYTLNVHSGCVNTICWDSNGRHILSGSDDLYLCITDAYTGEKKSSIRTGHMTNIFSAKYLPNTDDVKVVSCSGDGVIIYTDLNCPETAHKNIFDCHDESVYDIVTVPNDPNTFLTCCHDNTVRWYDLRMKTFCQNHSLVSSYRTRHRCTDDILILCDYPVTALTVNHLLPWQLAVGCSDSIIRIFDRRMLSTKSMGNSFPSSDQNGSVVMNFTYDGVKDSNRITSLAYSKNCQQLLASYSNDNLYLFNLLEVRNTVKNAIDDDVFLQKTKKDPPQYKRFRLRGDWSDTGPRSVVNVSDPNEPVDDADLRNFETIWNIVFRNRLLQQNIRENLNNNRTSENVENEVLNNNGPQSNSNNTNDNQSQPEMQSEANRTPDIGQPTESLTSSNMPANNSGTGDNSDSSSDSLGVFIHIINEDYQLNSSQENGMERNSAEQANNSSTEQTMEDEDFDSDTTSGSITNHDTTANSLDVQRQRSNSSSSNDSRQSTRRKTRMSHGSESNSQTKKSEDSNNSNKNVNKHFRTYKIKNFKKFVGHRNSRTVIKKATFWGDDFIISGSDCGHIFFWSIESGEVVMLLEGDQHVVNCLQPHPTDPILASSGIDYNIKIWGTDAQEDSLFDEERTRILINRNKTIAEDSRDTVTVPARFIVSLFTSLPGNRNNSLNRQWNRANPSNTPNRASGSGSGSSSYEFIRFSPPINFSELSDLANNNNNNDNNNNNNNQDNNN